MYICFLRKNSNTKKIQNIIMCGILFYINADIDTIHSQNFLNRVLFQNKKRGPETSSTYLSMDASLFMAFHRLAINGINEESSQPFKLLDCVMVGNGEIFNFKELEQKYNFKYTTNSDMEVILHMYRLHGPDFIHEINGEFSFVIFDKLSNEILVFRDNFGIRPLYYLTHENQHIFSSTLKSLTLLKTQIKSTQSIKHFEPAHMLKFIFNSSKNEYCIHSYSPYFFLDKIKPNIQSTDYENLYNLLYKAIERRIITTERPFGALLSGGLDSSIVCAIAQDICKKRNLPTLHTFSIGMPGSDDLKFADKVSKHIGSIHHTVQVTEEEFIGAIPQVVFDIESYDTTTVRASVGNWLIGKYIRENTNIKVVLNGDGADELMGGYLYFKQSPSSFEFRQDCIRLLKNIHQFDVLRSDRSISSHGLESRTPFLDQDLVKYYLSLDENATFTPNMEKLTIRSAIHTCAINILPHEVLWRQKEAFSDGVSSAQKSWFQIIQDTIENMNNTDEDIRIKLHMLQLPSHLKCDTLEKKYYYYLFSSFFGRESNNIIPYYWMPNFVNATDASARTLTFYNNK